MNTSLRIVSALASLVLVGSSFEAGEVLAPAATTSVPVAADDDEALHEAMEGMQSGLRSLRKQISPEGKAEALETVRAMQVHTVVAFGYIPAIPEGTDAATTLTWGTDYKARMLKLGLELVALEELLLQDDIDGAKATYRKLSTHKKEGHDKYYNE